MLPMLGEYVHVDEKGKPSMRNEGISLMDMCREAVKDYPHMIDIFEAKNFI